MDSKILNSRNYKVFLNEYQLNFTIGYVYHSRIDYYKTFKNIIAQMFENEFLGIYWDIVVEFDRVTILVHKWQLTIELLDSVLNRVRTIKSHELGKHEIELREHEFRSRQ